MDAHVRPAAGEPEGTLVLFHGRGADELDLAPLLDALDPQRRLTGITPGAPLTLPPGGRHWYAVHEIGYPDPATFHATYALVTEWLDSLALDWDRTAIGGFSQGAVMSHALALGAGRPRPAAVLAFSGFVPTVDGFDLELSQPLPRYAIGHGTFDPVIRVEWGRRARALLEDAGADVVYREAPLPHTIDPRFVAELQPWLQDALRAPARSEASSE